MPPLYTEAADLIADKYADSPDIGHFCEGLGFLSHGESALGAPVRAALAGDPQGQSRWAVRCKAQFALASVVQSTRRTGKRKPRHCSSSFARSSTGNIFTPFKGLKRLQRLGPGLTEGASIPGDGRPARRSRALIWTAGH